MDAATVRNKFRYCSETGYLFHTSGRCKGMRAGCVSPTGYRFVFVGGKSFLEHRIVWLHVNGSLPEAPNVLDHVNGLKTDNRISNLRVVTPHQNSTNQRLGKNNASGYKGVCWDRQRSKWRASIKVYGKQQHLGFYDSSLLAHAAYIAAAKRFFGEFARVA